MIRWLRNSTYILLAVLTYAVLPYDIAAAKQWQPGWVCCVVLRNMILVHLLYGGWVEIRFAAR